MARRALALRAHREARRHGVYRYPAGVAPRARVHEAAAAEGHALHVPQAHMLQKVRAVGRIQVVVVYGEGAVRERALVVDDQARIVGAGVGQVLHRLGAVAECGVVGGDNAAGGIPSRARCAGANALDGVLDDGAVEELHGALVGGGLRLVAVSFHIDTLPHPVLAGAGQCAAIHDELAARLNDDAG